MDVLSRLDRFPSYERSAAAEDLSQLSSIRRLLGDLGHPENDYRVVHVVGTHGKGLTAAMIAATLKGDGERVGLYTSPYVLDPREEVQVDGTWLSEDAFGRLAETILAVAEGYDAEGYDAKGYDAEGYDGEVPLSRFDLMTAIAFLAFSRAEVDWAVVEAGLGGRFDSTNVTDKDLVVITPIDHDHTAILGDSLADIAEHKLGVLRPGTPVVVAQQDPRLAAAMEKRWQEESRAVVHSRELEVRPTMDPMDPGRQELCWPDGAVHITRFPPLFPFCTYLECLRTALMARSVLAAGPESADQRVAWATAAMGVILPGRLSHLENVCWHGRASPEGTATFGQVVLDGCHSPTAVLACAGQLTAWGLKRYSLVLGLSSDKLTPGLRCSLRSLCWPAAEILLTPFDSPRSATPAAMASYLTEVDAALAPRLRTVRCLDAAMTRAARRPDRPLVVAGSLYLIRDVLPGLGPV